MAPRKKGQPGDNWDNEICQNVTNIDILLISFIKIDNYG